jgi:hypothetical protein
MPIWLWKMSTILMRLFEMVESVAMLPEGALWNVLSGLLALRRGAALRERTRMCYWAPDAKHQLTGYDIEVRYVDYDFLTTG